jgi:hypothetical protein
VVSQLAQHGVAPPLFDPFLKMDFCWLLTVGGRYNATRRENHYTHLD